jgi:phytoene dehydrogenase-like protein
MINHEEFGRYEGNGGKTFIFYTDLDRLERHMLDLSPADKTVIKEFINSARAFTQFDLPALKAPELFGPVEGMATLWKMRPFFKWKGVSVRDFAGRFSDPFLSEALGSFGDDFPMPLVFFLLTMAWMHQKVAGYPVGGSLEFAGAIERRYLALGGEINYRAKVVEILAENNRVAGVGKNERVLAMKVTKSPPVRLEFAFLSNLRKGITHRQERRGSLTKAARAD